MIKKLRGELLTSIALASLILMTVASIGSISIIKNQKQSYKSLAYEVGDGTPTKRPTARPTPRTNTPPTKPASATSNCPSTGFFATQAGCAQQCGQSTANCKTCKHQGVDKWYCNGTNGGGGGGGGLSSLPSCTTPNSYSGCPTECNGQCEPCNAGGVQKNHCKLNSATAGLKSCVAASYIRQADCNPHCGTQCSACKIGTTVKYECSAEFNSNIPKCGNGITYSSQESCKAPSACGASGKCALCESTPGNNRYECNGSGPTVPLTQTPVGIGDCKYGTDVIPNNTSKCSTTTGGTTSSILVTCNNGVTSTSSCPSGCSNGQCVTAPVTTQPPTSSNQCYSTGGGSGSCGSIGRYSSTSCSPSCGPDESCCGGLIPDAQKICTPGQQQCAQGTIQVCKSDGTGWFQQACSTGFCASATACQPDYNPNATSCQFVCRKYSCLSDETQMSQACIGAVDSVCCRPPFVEPKTTITLAPQAGLGSKCSDDNTCQLINPYLFCIDGTCQNRSTTTPTKSPLVGQVCAYDSDCGDPDNFECKWDRSTNKRYCAQRTVPATTNTQCDTINMGTSCNYESGGKLYFGQCDCGGGSCRCVGSVANPTSSVVHELPATPTPPPSATTCTVGSCQGSNQYCSQTGWLRGTYEWRTCPMSQICVSGGCRSVACNAGDRPFRNENGVCQACYAMNSTPSLKAVNDSLCAKADTDPKYVPQPGDIATNALAADDRYNARQDIFAAVQKNAPLSGEAFAAAGLSLGDKITHGLGWIGEKFNQGLYETTGGSVGNYASDQAGSSFGNMYEAQMNANAAAAAAGEERFDILNTNSYDANGLNLGQNLLNTTTVGLLGGGQYMANTILGLPAAVGITPAQNLLDSYNNFNTNTLNKMYSGRDYEVAAAQATQQAGGDVTDAVALLVPLGKGASALGQKITNAGTKLENLGTLGKVASKGTGLVGNTVETLGRSLQAASPESLAAGFIKAAPITRTAETIAAKAAKLPGVSNVISVAKTVGTTATELPVIGGAIKTGAWAREKAVDLTKSLLLPESSLTFGLDDAGKYLADDAARGLVDLADPDSVLKRLNDTYGIKLEAGQVDDLVGEMAKHEKNLPANLGDDLANAIENPPVRTKTLEPDVVNKLDDASENLDAAKKELDDYQTQLAEQQAKLDEMDTNGVKKTDPEYRKTQTQIADLNTKVDAAQTKVRGLEEQLVDDLGKARPDQAAALKKQNTAVNNAQQKVDNALADLNTAQNELTAAQKQVIDNTPRGLLGRGGPRKELRKALAEGKSLTEAINDLDLKAKNPKNSKLLAAIDAAKKAEDHLNKSTTAIDKAQAALEQAQTNLALGLEQQLESIVPTKPLSQTIKKASAALKTKLDNSLASIKQKINDWRNRSKATPPPSTAPATPLVAKKTWSQTWSDFRSKFSSKKNTVGANTPNAPVAAAAPAPKGSFWDKLKSKARIDNRIADEIVPKVRSNISDLDLARKLDDLGLPSDAAAVNKARNIINRTTTLNSEAIARTIQDLPPGATVTEINEQLKRNGYHPSMVDNAVVDQAKKYLEAKLGYGTVNTRTVKGHGGVVQDKLYVQPHGFGAAVADGVTGAGPKSASVAERASSELSTALENAYTKFGTNLQAIHSAVSEAVVSLREELKVNTNTYGGGSTTVSAVRMTNDGKYLIMSRVGDTEARIIRNGSLFDLDYNNSRIGYDANGNTIQHANLNHNSVLKPKASLGSAEQSFKPNQPNQIFNTDLFEDANPINPPRTTMHALQPGDRILVSSDGIAKALNEQEIRNILNSARTAQEAENNLLAAAQAKGMKDDYGLWVIFR